MPRNWDPFITVLLHVNKNPPDIARVEDGTHLLSSHVMWLRPTYICVIPSDMGPNFHSEIRWQNVPTWGITCFEIWTQFKLSLIDQRDPRANLQCSRNRNPHIKPQCHFSIFLSNGTNLTMSPLLKIQCREVGIQLLRCYCFKKTNLSLADYKMGPKC